MKIFRQLVRVMVGATSLFLTYHPHGYGKEMAQDQGLSIKLETEGLQLVSQYLSENVLSPIHNQQLPDIEENLDLNFKLKSTGMRYSAEFSNVQLQSHEGHLTLAIDLKSLQLAVTKFQITSVPPLSASCWDTKFALGRKSPLELQAKIALWVEDFQLQGKITQVDLPMNQEDIIISGPARCSGQLGAGKFLAKIVNRIIYHQWQNIQKTLIRKVNGLTPAILQKLTEFTNRRYPLDLGIFTQKPGTQLLLSTRPYRLHLSPQGVEVELSLESQLTDRLIAGPSLTRPTLLPHRQIGSIGINPLVVSEILQAAMKPSGITMELTDSTFPRSKEVFSRKALAAIWPDLNAIALEEDRLRVFMSLKTAPKFSLSTIYSGIKFAISDWQWVFKIKQEGEWRDYFHLNLSFESQAFTEVVNSVLKVRLDDNFNLEIDGQWDEEYSPEIPLFEKEMFSLIFTSLWEYVQQSGSIYTRQLPHFKLGKNEIILEGVANTSPYLRIFVAY